MVKKGKIVLVFVLVIMILLAFVPSVKADDSIPNILILDENEEEENVANEPVQENNTLANENTEPIVNEPITNESNGEAENKLPQTGVLEDTTLFAFIVICVIIAIYAYTKVKNYKNI